MEMQPEVIPITDFRRAAARIIDGPISAGTPVFITQCGYVTAVALSPERYRDILRDLEDARRAAARAPSETPPLRDRWVDDDFGLIDAEAAETMEADGWDLA
jgi:hypothetical protein